jgi:hypothetical protein
LFQYSVDQRQKAEAHAEVNRAQHVLRTRAAEEDRLVTALTAATKENSQWQRAYTAFHSSQVTLASIEKKLRVVLGPHATATEERVSSVVEGTSWHLPLATSTQPTSQLSPRPAKRARVLAREEPQPHPLLTRESTSEPLELNAKLLALRQHIEVLDATAKDKNKRAKELWKLTLVRTRLVANVLECFKPLQFPALIWRSTVVTFVGEDGIDEGGLTADLHSSFWRDVFKSEHGLFEQLTEEGAYLPRAQADVSQLASVGRFLLKSVLDDHPTGPSLSTFLLEFVCGAHEMRAFRDTHPIYALQLLANVDGTVAQSWSNLLCATDDELSESLLTLDDFDESLPAVPLTPTNVARAVVAGCRRKLLVDRHEALVALRDGFTLNGKLDFGLQLAQHRNADLALLLQGKAVVSAEELLGCFDWSDPPPPCAAAVDYLRTAISEDDAHLDVPRRLLLLRFCTGLNALPVSGLTRKVTFNFLDKPSGLPEPHTCTHELDLPAYGCKAELLEKLILALDSFEADPSFGQQ